MGATSSPLLSWLFFLFTLSTTSFIFIFYLGRHEFLHVLLVLLTLLILQTGTSEYLKYYDFMDDTDLPESVTSVLCVLESGPVMPAPSSRRSKTRWSPLAEAQQQVKSLSVASKGKSLSR